MKEFRVQFDPKKAKENFRKHKVHLADGEGPFYDPLALTMEDENPDEQRWVTIGNDGTGRILVVSYTYRDPDFVRLISTRKAEPHEIDEYLAG
jgi:hypothetical protein